MPFRELFGKVIAFLVVAAAFGAAGWAVLYGPHATMTGTINFGLGVGLMLLGLLTLVIGAFIIFGVIRDAKLQRRAHELHVTQRSGPPAPPPAWGMGDVGRPNSGMVQASGMHPMGGGAVRTVTFNVSNADVPLVIGYLMIWTVVGILDPFYLIYLAAATVVLGGIAAAVYKALFRRR